MCYEMHMYMYSYMNNMPVSGNTKRNAPTIRGTGTRLLQVRGDQSHFKCDYISALLSIIINRFNDALAALMIQNEMFQPVDDRVHGRVYTLGLSTVRLRYLWQDVLGWRSSGRKTALQVARI